MKTSIKLLLILLTFASVAVAQSHKDKVEVGVHSTSLTLFSPDFPGDETSPGFGGRVTYNFNRSIAAEAEVNFFPQKQFILIADGSALQAQFGVKLGKRFEKFGVFARVRPGFLSVNRFFSLKPDLIVVNGQSQFDFRFERTEFFTLDAGGVLELYPSKRMVVRFDAGDTVIRHPDRREQVFGIPPSVRLARPAKFNHNFQFTAGVAFRLGDFPSSDSNPKTSDDGSEQTPRFEVGAQFTSLSVDPVSSACFGCQSSVERIHTEPGLGGRFTFNLTENIAFEAEGNFYTRNLGRFVDSGGAGHMFQGQFGAKIGRRFGSWGLFAKARPGFVGFTKFDKLVGTRTVQVGGVQAVVPEFKEVRKAYPSIDLGGVLEFYISRRWMARLDAGDTLIRYSDLRSNPFSIVPLTLPPETRHNFQFTSGIGFRF